MEITHTFTKFVLGAGNCVMNIDRNLRVLIVFFYEFLRFYDFVGKEEHNICISIQYIYSIALIIF